MVKEGGMRGEGGVHGKGGMPPPPFYEIRPVNARAVCILLECILVFYCFIISLSTQIQPTFL